jgi:uncharacterized membrane protein YdbT with pleckstrin-like domain
MASYVDTHLLSGERVLYRATLSPAVAYEPAIGLAVASLGLAVASRVTAMAPVVSLSVFQSMALVFLVCAAGSALAGHLQIKANEYALTDRRVVVKRGLLVRSSVEILLSKVEGLTVDQNIRGRIFGFGSVTVNGTGGGRDPFKGVAEPFELRGAVQHQLEVVNKTPPR